MTSVPFCELGKKTRILPGALKPPDLSLHDYSHCPIPVGLWWYGGAGVQVWWMMGHNACVLKSDVAGGGETCLLGTNVTIPLGVIILHQVWWKWSEDRHHPQCRGMKCVSRQQQYDW